MKDEVKPMRALVRRRSSGVSLGLMRDVLLSFVIAIAGGGGSCSDGRGLVAEGFRAGAHPSGFRYQRFVQCAHQHLIESHASSSR